jgi:DNA-binding NarL/FixJ family response regulator
MSTSIKRVLIADDHDIIRRGLHALVESRPNLQVVAEASNGREALHKAKEIGPDIAIVDYSMPKVNGRDLIVELKRAEPTIEILIYTMHDRTEIIWDVLRAGARAIVLKSDTETHLFAALDALSSHRPYFSGRILETLLNQYLRDQPTTPTLRQALTLREREVVQLIAEGNFNRKVAQKLNIGVKTVETHRASAMRKLRLRKPADLVRYAVRNNLIEA